jgi:hypothetical protein
MGLPLLAEKARADAALPENARGGRASRPTRRSFKTKR